MPNYTATAVRVVCAKHIIQEMLTDSFWADICRGQGERLVDAVCRAIEKLSLDRLPETDEEASALITQWTLPVRVEVAEEFGLLKAAE